MRELFIEIFQSIKNNKLRTALTGFAISWGIFMLIVLLGSGNGLKNAFSYNARAFNSNLVTIYSGRTSLPYKGQARWREVKFDNRDIEMINREMSDNIIHISPYFNGNGTLSVGTKSVETSISGISEKYIVEGHTISVTRGRTLNHNDIKEKQKVILIDTNLEDRLFKKQKLASIGSYISYNGIMFKVVGIINSSTTNMNMQAYIPYTTYDVLLKKGGKYDSFQGETRGLNTQEDIDLFKSRLRKNMALLHNYSPNDTRGIWMYVSDETNISMSKTENALTIALWVVGILTLLSGIVGVANIMLITVKERTREFGIRKAIGAKSRSILLMIISESITITSIFGYIGMVLGIVVTEYMNKEMGGSKVMNMGEFSFAIFKDPTVDLSIAIQAVITLIIAGTLAGLFPALRAVKIKPIDALNAR